MIERGRGNILEANVQALVNPVNCVGVMGKGLALTFKEIYPNNFLEYRTACNAGKVIPGKMFITKTDSVINPAYIINFPTKRHWREGSRIEDIRSGLVSLAEEVNRLRIFSVAIPALGCGNGGLKWEDIESLIITAFVQLPEVSVILFPPQGI